MKKIGITLGEPCGIGPELVVRAVSKSENKEVQFVLYGSPKLLEKTAKDLDIRPFWSASDRVELKTVGPDRGEFPIEDRRLRAEAVLAMLDAASTDCLQGSTSALVTAPIDKSIVVRTILPSFSGHTEYLGEKAKVPRTVMLLDNGELRVALFTNHVPLREVPRLLTAETIEQVVRTTAKSLGVERPRFAVTGLNPHAGENTKNSEEETIFKPAIERLQKEGFQIEGPFPADSFFPRARNEHWDVIFSPYHDQGLVAAKYGGLDKVVNITLGLPYLRVSAAHGVAYDLAGKGKADLRSFERALQIAIQGRWVSR